MHSLQNSAMLHFTFQRTSAISIIVFAPFLITLPALAQEKEQKPGSSPAAPKIDADDAEAIETANRIEKKVEELRGLAFKNPVKKGIYDKERLAKFLQKQTEKEKVDKQYAWQEKAYKILGLIPDEMDMMKETTDVLMEQIGGFYDPETKELRVMRGFKGFIGDILMAHELCHALEDQHFNLQSIDDFNKKNAPDNDDRVFAAHAVMEGSATFLMNQFALDAAQEGKVDFKELLKSDLSANPALSGERAMKSPGIIVKPLLEMYISGAAFLNRGAGMMAKAKKSDIRKAFANPPLSSEQVLHPDKYWKNAERDLPRDITIPDVTSDLGAGWTRLGTNVFGELGVAILTMPAAPAEQPVESDPIKLQMKMLTDKKFTIESEGWDGDRYDLYEHTDGTVLMFWASVWDTGRDAQEFVQNITKKLSKSGKLQIVSEYMMQEDGKLLVLARTPKGQPVDGTVAQKIMNVSEKLLKSTIVKDPVPYSLSTEEK